MKNYLPAIVLLSIGIALYLWKPWVGITFVVLACLLWLTMRYMEHQHAQWTERFGSDIANKIREKRVEVGMTREVVELIWGQGMVEKTRTTAKGSKVHCLYGTKDAAKGVKRKRFHAVYENDVLIEYGERA